MKISEQVQNIIDNSSNGIFTEQLIGLTDDEIKYIVDTVVPGGPTIKAIIYSGMFKNINKLNWRT